MSMSNDMPAPASAMGSTPRRGDGVAAPRSTVDIELVCVKGERNSERSRNSWASREVIDGKGASDHDQDRIDGNRRASKMFLGQEMVLDAGTEWRVKWSQRGIGTFGFLGILSYIVGWSIRNNTFQILAIVFGGIVLLCVVFLLY